MDSKKQHDCAFSMPDLMGTELSLAGLQDTQLRQADLLKQLNEMTAAAGLKLTEDELTTLAQQRREALSTNERIEFGEGILKELVSIFASSPYLEQDKYAQSLVELQSIFYRMKDELSYPVADELLLLAMRKTYDTEAGGSLEALEALQAHDILAAMDAEDEFEPEPDLSSSLSEEYRLVDAAGKVYSWNPEEWHDDEFGLGWEGEKWSDDL